MGANVLDGGGMKVIRHVKLDGWKHPHRLITTAAKSDTFLCDHQAFGPKEEQTISYFDRRSGKDPGTPILSRMPGLVATNAPFFLGRALQQDEVSCVSTLRTRFTRLYKSDRIYLRLEFKKNTANAIAWETESFFFTYDDNSKHLGTKSHIWVL
eukprot:scaffold3450_cov114-Cylindrotheca_fusiformis.AAC.12